MGMTDESWCMSCGTSLPYSENDTSCGDCVIDTVEDLMAGIFLYLTNLKGELEERLELADGADPIFHYLEGAVETVVEVESKINEMYRNV